MASHTHPLTVFLAEDSAAIRERVGSLLSESAMQVVGEGDSPQACITGILRARPDVVVLDCQLDGGSGLEVLQAVRRADPGIAFVVFSNTTAAPYRKRYLAAGAVRFLDKSAEFEQLADAVAGARPPLPH